MMCVPAWLKILLELDDAVVALGPNVLGDQLVHADDEHVLVVRAVEDGDLPVRRGRFVRPPQKVVRCFLRRRLFESVDVRALRVERAKHVPDRAVLAAGIHRLEDDEQSACVFGVEAVLQLAQALDVLVDSPLGLRPRSNGRR